MTILPRHRVRLPDPAGLFKNLERDDQAFLLELVGALQRELDTCVRTNAALRELLLLAPDESAWSVQVSNAGALTITRPTKRVVMP